jgi:hypothetical protein
VPATAMPGPVRIGGFDERETKGQRNDYLTLKL